MRKWIIGMLVVLLFATLVWAATLTVTVPPGAATSNAVDQCENLRVAARVLAANWDNDLCATVMARAGVRAETETEAKAVKQASVTTCVSNADNTFQSTMNTFDTDWPFPATISSCGDGATDSEFGEECDDSGESATCNIDCTNHACGDGVLNATAGEECDDGNTTPGDGCSATCQNEP